MTETKNKEKTEVNLDFPLTAENWKPVNDYIKSLAETFNLERVDCGAGRDIEFSGDFEDIREFSDLVYILNDTQFGFS